MRKCLDTGSVLGLIVTPYSQLEPSASFPGAPPCPSFSLLIPILPCPMQSWIYQLMGRGRLGVSLGLGQSAGAKGSRHVSAAGVCSSGDHSRLGAKLVAEPPITTGPAAPYGGQAPSLGSPLALFPRALPIVMHTRSLPQGSCPGSTHALSPWRANKATKGG